MKQKDFDFLAAWAVAEGLNRGAIASLVRCLENDYKKFSGVRFYALINHMEKVKCQINRRR